MQHRQDLKARPSGQRSGQRLSPALLTPALDAPPVSKGDLYYNFIDHNLTGGEAQRIDTSRVAVYLLTGEYGWENSPDQRKILAGQIKESQFTEMKGLGHFSMAEKFCGI